MAKVQLKNLLYTGKEEIEILIDKDGNPMHKNTCEFGAMGLGKCAPKYRGSANAIPKYNNIMRCLDAIFMDNAVNAICSDDAVYGEYNDGKDIYRFLATEDKISYENKAITDSKQILPAFLYSIRNNAEIEEMRDVFVEIRDKFNAEGRAIIKDSMLICDTYYYAIAKKGTEIEIAEDDLQMDTVKASVKSGLLGNFSVFKGMELPKFTGIKMETPKTEREQISNKEMFEKMRAGKTVIDYNWSEKQRARIPSLTLLESFIPSQTYFSISAKVRTILNRVKARLDEGLTGIDAIRNDYANIFLTGKPGTGKTASLYALGAALGLPVYTIPMTKNTEEDVFQGMNKVIDGTLKFVSTDFLDAYTNGGIILLEEINLPDPSVTMGSLGQAVEFPFTLMQDGYIPVKRHPMCVIIGTMNIGTYGSKGVNQALSSRFRQSYILNDPTKDDFINILMKTGANKKQSTWVYNAYDRIVDYLKSPDVNAEDVCLNVTLRGCLGALENITEGEDAKEALRNTLIGKISEVDLQLAEDVYKDVVLALPELY